MGIGGLALSSSSVGWLDRMNCGVCPYSHLLDCGTHSFSYILPLRLVSTNLQFFFALADLLDPVQFFSHIFRN